MPWQVATLIRAPAHTDWRDCITCAELEALFYKASWPFPTAASDPPLLSSEAALHLLILGAASTFPCLWRSLEDVCRVTCFEKCCSKTRLHDYKEELNSECREENLMFPSLEYSQKIWKKVAPKVWETNKNTQIASLNLSDPTFTPTTEDNFHFHRL